MKRNTTNFITNLSLVILAFAILLLPIFDITDIKLILIITFGLYTLFKFTNFIMFRKELDFESLFISLISLIAVIITFIYDLKPKYLILLILGWMSLNALIKLKKVDYYHDRQNKMWLLKIFMLFIFITSGLVAGLNLFNEETQIVAIGLFFLISGLLDTTEALVNIVVGDKNASNK